MPAPNRKWIGTAACAIVVAVAGYAGMRNFGRTTLQPNSAAAASAAESAQQPRITLDPMKFVGDVRKAYQVAERNPALLAQLHCYCGCDRSMGHKNLLDCFRDTHGSNCPICTGEAIEADQLANQGMPVEQIRDALRSRYANGH